MPLPWFYRLIAGGFVALGTVHMVLSFAARVAGMTSVEQRTLGAVYFGTGFILFAINEVAERLPPRS